MAIMFWYRSSLFFFCKMHIHAYMYNAKTFSFFILILPTRFRLHQTVLWCDLPNFNIYFSISFWFVSFTCVCVCVHSPWNFPWFPFLDKFIFATFHTHTHTHTLLCVLCQMVTNFSLNETPKSFALLDPIHMQRNETNQTFFPVSLSLTVLYEYTTCTVLCNGILNKREISWHFELFLVVNCFIV